jgi:hypothetical protein
VLLDEQNNIFVLKIAPKLVFLKVSFHNEDELWIDGPDMDTLKLQPIKQLDQNSKILTFK